MPSFSPPASLLCVLVCVTACACALHRTDLRLAYVTDHSLYYCSCVRDLQPCTLLSPVDCSCKDLPLSVLHRPQADPAHSDRTHSDRTHSARASSPVVRTRRLTVWYTSAPNAALLLNNSEVRHLTLIHCSPPGAKMAASQSPVSQEGYFAVQHLERLTLTHLQWEPVGADKGRNGESNADTERGAWTNAERHGDRGIWDRDLDLDLVTETRRVPAPALLPSLPQDIWLGREQGAEHNEQARLGLLHVSILEGGAAAKAYTVQTHIDSSGALPFPNLHLSRLPETSSIYVTFIYT